MEYVTALHGIGLDSATTRRRNRTAEKTRLPIAMRENAARSTLRFHGARRDQGPRRVRGGEIAAASLEVNKDACTGGERRRDELSTYLHMHPWPLRRSATTTRVLGLPSASRLGNTEHGSRLTAVSSACCATSDHGDDDGPFWSSLTRNAHVQRTPYRWSTRRRSIYFGSSAGEIAHTMTRAHAPRRHPPIADMADRVRRVPSPRVRPSYVRRHALLPPLFMTNFSLSAIHVFH